MGMTSPFFDRVHDVRWFQIRLDFSVGLIAGNQYRAGNFKIEESRSNFFGQIVAKLFGEKHDHNNELIAEHNINKF